MHKEIRIRIWNVLTLYKGGALRNLEKMLQEYKVDITALQEIRWVGQGILERRGSNIQGIHTRMVRLQKLTRNLFLTLHGHNVHHQQW